MPITIPACNFSSLTNQNIEQLIRLCDHLRVQYRLRLRLACHSLFFVTLIVEAARKSFRIIFNLRNMEHYVEDEANGA